MSRRTASNQREIGARGREGVTRPTLCAESRRMTPRCLALLRRRAHPRVRVFSEQLAEEGNGRGARRVGVECRVERRLGRDLERRLVVDGLLAYLLLAEDVESAAPRNEQLDDVVR